MWDIAKREPSFRGGGPVAGKLCCCHPTIVAAKDRELGTWACVVVGGSGCGGTGSTSVSAKAQVDGLLNPYQLVQLGPCQRACA